jgi:hypothetical protein
MNYRVVKVKKLAGLLLIGMFSFCLAPTTMAQGKPRAARDRRPTIIERRDRLKSGGRKQMRSAEMDVGAGGRTKTCRPQSQT